MLHSEYTTNCFMAKSVVWQPSEFKYKTDISFALNSYFIQPSVCYYVLFFFMSDCKYLLLPCVSDTLAGDFLSHSWTIKGRSSYATPPRFSQKRIEIIFCKCCWPQKLKSAKNNRNVFETKPRKFGDAKIFHYMVSFWMSYWHSEPWTCLLNGEYEEHIKM